MFAAALFFIHTVHVLHVVPATTFLWAELLSGQHGVLLRCIEGLEKAQTILEKQYEAVEAVRAEVGALGEKDIAKADEKALLDCRIIFGEPCRSPLPLQLLRPRLKTKIDNQTRATTVAFLTCINYSQLGAAI